MTTELRAYNAQGERQHVRIVNGGTPQLIPTRDALAEMNHAMMDGKKDVREMSAARGHARIVYKDRERGTVTLRPATADDHAPVATRPTADVLAADPIPADASVLDGMPGREITRQELRTPADVLTHTDYVVQLRDAGIWTLPNHDDGCTMTRGQVAHALRCTLDSAPDRARTTRDDNGTVYLSTGRRAARYIPTARLADHSAGQCPGCGTPYATNGDGPCSGGRSTAKAQPAPEEQQAAALLGNGQKWIRYTFQPGQEEYRTVRRESALSLIVESLRSGSKVYPSAEGLEIQPTHGTASYRLQPFPAWH